MMESLIAFKRAGACGVLTYFAPRVAEKLKKAGSPAGATGVGSWSSRCNARRNEATTGSARYGEHGHDPEAAGAEALEQPSRHDRQDGGGAANPDEAIRPAPFPPSRAARYPR